MHSKIKTKNTLGEKIWIYCAKQQIAHINNQHTVYHIVCLTEKRVQYTTQWCLMVEKNLKFDWTDNFINNTTQIYILNIK